MKKTLLAIYIIIVVAAVVSGCEFEKKNNNTEPESRDKVTVSEGLFDENGFALDKQISLSFGYDKNQDGNVFENDNNKINTKLWFESGDYELEVGILIFADGILQPVSVEGQEEKTFNVFKVNKKSEYNIGFDLVSGDEGEKVRIDTISLLNPNFEITENTNSFGLCFMSSSPLPFWTECKVSVGTDNGAESFDLTELSDEVKEKHIITQDNGKVTNNLETSMNIQYFQNGEEVTKLKVIDNILEFDMDIYGGKGEYYNIYVFFNNEPLQCFNGKEYNKVTIAADKTTNVAVKADISEKNIGEYSQLFVVAVPAGEVKDSDTEVYKLSNIIVDNSALEGVR